MSLPFRGHARYCSVIVVNHQGVACVRKGPKVNINQACPQIVGTINQGERKVQYSLNKMLQHFCRFYIFREALEAYEGLKESPLSAILARFLQNR